MKSPRQVDCADVEALLNLEAPESRPDRRMLMTHLEACSQCRSRAPELVWLYSSMSRVEEEEIETVGSRRHREMVWAVVVCVFLLGVAGLFLGQRDVDVSLAPSEVTDTEAGHSRVLPEHYSTVAITSTHAAPSGSTSSTTKARLISPGAHGSRSAVVMEWIR